LQQQIITVSLILQLPHLKCVARII